jgi:aminoglycoside phosphotransferase
MENKDNKIIDKKKNEVKHDNPVSQPDPETLHKTDPQENMKGPISSLMNKAADKAEQNAQKDKVDEKKFEEKEEAKKNNDV